MALPDPLRIARSSLCFRQRSCSLSKFHRQLANPNIPAFELLFDLFSRCLCLLSNRLQRDPQPVAFRGHSAKLLFKRVRAHRIVCKTVPLFAERTNPGLQILEVLPCFFEDLPQQGKFVGLSGEFTLQFGRQFVGLLQIVLQGLIIRGESGAECWSCKNGHCLAFIANSVHDGDGFSTNSPAFFAAHLDPAIVQSAVTCLFRVESQELWVQYGKQMKALLGVYSTSALRAFPGRIFRARKAKP
jgi:hypothetical protein